MFFQLGDYIAGMLTGTAIALAVRALVWPGMDMVLAMLLGMAVGMAIHLILGLLLSPLFGMFETMIPGTVIGMYGGMMFGMRDSMAAGSRTLGAVALVGAVLGAAVVLAFKIYNRAIRGVVLDAEE